MNPILSSNINTTNIKFSILVPSYNRPEYLYKTILSILLIKNSNFELIISDDNSPLFNKIQKLISSIDFNIPFKYFQQAENIGPTANKNFLVQSAKGEFVILIGDDDLINPEILNVLDNEINKCENVSIYGFGYNVIDEFDNKINQFRSYKSLIFDNSNKLKNIIFFEGNIIPFYFFHPFTLCYRKSINIIYKQEAHIGYDFLFLFESLANDHKIKILTEIGFSWRKAQTLGNYQNLSNNKQSDLISRVGIYNYFFLNPTYINKLKFRLKENHFFKFIGDTLLLNPNILDKNLDLIKTQMNINFRNNLLKYLNTPFLKFKNVLIKISQCIVIQGIFSLQYFNLRFRNILIKKYYSHKSKYNHI